MRLTYRCAACKQRNYLPENDDDRAALHRRLAADVIRVDCKNCGKSDKKHLNKITAVVDNRLILLGIPLGVIMTVLLIYIFGLIGVFTLSVPIYIWSYEQKKAHQFNIFRIRK